MRDGLIILGLPPGLLLGPLDLLLMGPLKHSVTRDVESRGGHVVPDSLEDISLRDARGLQERGEIVDAEMPVGTTVAFPGARLVFGEDLLAGERRVATTTPVGVPADVAVRVPHVVPILFVERVVRDQLEAGSPEHKALFEAEAESF